MLAALPTTLLIFPGVVFQTTFNEKRSAFRAILVDNLRLFTECRNINEQDFLAVFTAFGFILVIDRQTEFHDGHLARQIFKLRVAREVADENDLVVVGHENLVSGMRPAIRF